METRGRLIIRGRPGEEASWVEMTVPTLEEETRTFETMR
jgi:hypothetical protein